LVGAADGFVADSVSREQPADNASQALTVSNSNAARDTPY
jgi:hypothetical protein